MSNSNKRQAIFSKGEALNFAAERLEQMAGDIELAELVMGMIKPGDLKGDDADKLDDLRTIYREPELQRTSLRDAARAIRELAIEERLMNARATQHAATTRV